MKLNDQLNQYMKNEFNDFGVKSFSWKKLQALWANRFYINSLYLLISNVLGAVLGFVFWIIAAHLYTTEQVGLASAVISAIGLLALFSCVGLSEGVVRFFPREDADVNSFLNTVLSILLVTSLLASVIFIVGLGFWSPKLLFIRQSPIYLVFFVIMTLFYVLSTTLDSLYIARRKAVFALIRSAIFNGLKLVLIILFALFITSAGIMTAWGISVGIALLAGVFLFFRYLQPHYKPSPVVIRKVVNDVVHFSIASYTASLLGSGTISLLPIIVINLLGAEANAYFYIAWSIGTVLQMIPSSIATSLFAEGSNNENSLVPNIKRSIKMGLILMVPSVIIIFILARWLLGIFNKDYADNAATLLRILVIAMVPNAINTVYLSIKKVEKNIKIIYLVSAALAVMDIGLTYVLVPHMGINGAGIAWLASQIIVAICILFSFLFRHKSKGSTAPNGNIG